MAKVNRPYPPRFQREHAPGWIGAVLSALGRASRPVLSVCEIGCGQGFGLSALAAANPGLSLVGLDVDPGHIAAATRLAEEVGLENLSFHQADIRDPAYGAGYDLILCHGVYSWVDAETRAAIRRFAVQRLNPGGILCLHYMTLPGGAPFAAFRAVFQASEGPGHDGVAEGIARLAAMDQAGAGFFVAHPHAGPTLHHLAAEDPGYVAHDYLSADFAPLAVGQVMRDMAAEGFAHLGSAVPLENIDALSLPAATQALIAAERDPVVRETLKDIARNQALRTDLYARDAEPLDAGAHLRALAGHRFAALPGAPLSGGVTFDTRIGAVEGPEAVFSPILSRLARGSAGFADFASEAPFAGQPGLLNQALQMLLWSGLIHPLADVQTDEPARRFNRLVMARAADGDMPPALAAPKLGTALAVSAGDVRALAEGVQDMRLIRLKAFCPL